MVAATAKPAPKLVTDHDVKEILIRPADKKWGYKFGCDGLMSVEEACNWLSGISRDTLEALYNDGKLRKGKMPGGRAVMYCRRTVEEFASSTEV